jgi:hypothetical protein
VLEQIEGRVLMAGSITVNPVVWTPVGADQIATGYILNSAAVSGRVDAINISPNFDGHGDAAMFLGTAHGGVWRSTNFTSNAPNWVPLTDDVGERAGLAPAQQVGLAGIGSMAVDPNHPSVIYAGTGDYLFGETGGGVLKSTDGGNTWSVLGRSTFAGHIGINKLVVNPIDATGNTLYASSSDGIFVSRDGGATWQSQMVGLPAGAGVSDLDYTLSPFAPGGFTLYAGVGSGPTSALGIWKLNPGGDNTWHQMPMNLVDFTGHLVGQSAIGAIRLSADHSPGFFPSVYAVVSNSQPSQDPKHFPGAVLVLNVFSLGSFGQQWLPVSNFADNITQSGYSQSIGLAPDGKVFVGAIGTTESTDQGAHWTPIGANAMGQALTHVDEHAWAFYNGQVYAGNDGGIWRFNPQPFPVNGVLPQQRLSLNTAGLQTLLTRGASVSPTNPNVLIASAQDNGESVRRSSGNWVYVGGSDGGTVHFDPDPSSGGNVIYKLDSFGGLYRSDDTGASFHEVTPRIPGGPGVWPWTPFAIDPLNTSRLLLGPGRVYDSNGTVTHFSQLYESSDRGNHWRAISPELGGADISVVTYAPGSVNTIYVANVNGRVFRTTDDNGVNPVHWQEVDAGTPLGGPVTQLAVDPTNSNAVYATVGARVWRTLNGGASTWQDVTGDLPALNVNALAIYHAAGTASPVLFIGNGVGVFSSHLQGAATHWTRYGAGLPESRVVGLEFNTHNNRLEVTTWGRGVFEILVPREVAQVGGTPVAFGAYNNPSTIDQRQHGLVATPNGLVTEVYFGNPTFPGVGQGALNATTPLKGIVGLAGFFNPLDNYQHSIVATSDGVVHELFYANPAHPGNFLDPNGPVAAFAPGSIVALAGYEGPPGDGFEHAIVATRDGKVSEVYFGNPKFPGAKSQDVLAQFATNSIVAVAGYFDPDPADQFQHVLVATADGIVHEVKFASPAHPGIFVDAQGTVASFAAGSIVSLAGYYGPTGDGYEHAIVATRDGKVSEVYFGNPKFPGGKGQDVLGQFDPGRLVGVGGYTTSDGFQHVLVLTTDGVLSELRWRQDIGFEAGTT